MPLKATMLFAWVEPKPVPVIVIGAPIAPDVAERLKIFGTTVKGLELLVTESTVTITGPAPPVAAFGTGTVMEVLLQLVGEPVAALNVTELVPCNVPNPLPPIVTAVPAMPEVDDRLVMLGTTVNKTPLLGPLFTVTTTFPVVAEFGTVATIDLELQLVAVAGAPLNVTVLAP